MSYLVFLEGVSGIYKCDVVALIIDILIVVIVSDCGLTH